MLEQYLSRIDFDSYEDFARNFAIKVPDNFNFAYDVVDEWARTSPDKPALVWCDDQGDEADLHLRRDEAIQRQGGQLLPRLGHRQGRSR